MPARAKAKPPSRIRIEHAAPTVDGGRWPVKRTVGDTVNVSADIFRDGHEVLRAVVRWRAPGEKGWQESPLTAVDAHHDGVRWEGAFTVEAIGRTEWTIRAWVDTAVVTADTCPDGGGCHTSLILGRAGPGFAFGADLIAASGAWSADDVRCSNRLGESLAPSGMWQAVNDACDAIRTSARCVAVLVSREDARRASGCERDHVIAIDPATHLHAW